MATLQTTYDSIPDLRNGDANTYNILHVAAGIADHFKAIPLNVITPALPDIRSRISWAAAIYAQRLVDFGENEDKALAKGLVLSAVREGAFRAFRLLQADYIASQTMTAADARVNVALVGNMRITHEDTRDRLASFDATYVDDETLDKLMKVGYGALVTSGVILVRTETMHHFVDGEKNISRAVGGQVFGRGVAPPLGLTVDEFEDIAYHKGNHVVRTDLMVHMARSETTKERLMAVRLASAVVRVPAAYPSESAASAMLAVARKAMAITRLANVSINIGALARDVAAVSVGNMNTANDRMVSSGRAADLERTRGEDVAYCIGCVKASCTHVNSRQPTILRSKCLTRLAEAHSESVAEGVTQMDTSYRAIRERGRRGIIRGVGLFGAVNPDDTEPLPQDETMAQILSALVGNNTGGGRGANAAAAP